MKIKTNLGKIFKVSKKSVKPVNVRRVAINTTKKK